MSGTSLSILLRYSHHEASMGTPAIIWSALPGHLKFFVPLHRQIFIITSLPLQIFFSVFDNDDRNFNFNSKQQSKMCNQTRPRYTCCGRPNNTMIIEHCRDVQKGKSCQRVHRRQSLDYTLCDFCAGTIRKRAHEGAMRIREKFGGLARCDVGGVMVRLPILFPFSDIHFIPWRAYSCIDMKLTWCSQSHLLFLEHCWSPLPASFGD